MEGVATEVCGNELCLIWPDEWHGARNNVVEPSEYYWVQIRLPSLGQETCATKANHLEKELCRIPNRKLPGTTDLLPLYQSLLKEHARHEPYCESVMRETLHLLLSLVLRCSKTEARMAPQIPVHCAQLMRAIRWTKENVGDATLREMVKVSGSDAATFRKEFRAMMGLYPMEYLVRSRLHKAKEQLGKGFPITEVAHELGFSSSQYFATVFRKYEATSPSDFLERFHRESTSMEI